MESKKEDKRLEKGAETQTRLLMSALEIIAEEGVSGITAGKLSAKSRVSKSTIFHHFKVTHDIPLATLKLLMDEMMQPIQSVEYSSLEQYLKQVGSGLLDLSEQNATMYRAFFSFYHASLFDIQYRDILGNYLEEMKLHISQVCTGLVPHGTSKKEIEEMSLFIVTVLDGIGLHLLMGHSKENYNRVWEYFSQSILSRYT